MMSRSMTLTVCVEELVVECTKVSMAVSGIGLSQRLILSQQECNLLAYHLLSILQGIWPSV